MIHVEEDADDSLGREQSYPLVTEFCVINEQCTGERWEVVDEKQLARLIVIIAMGQAKQAINILSELSPELGFTTLELKNEAKIRLTVQSEKKEPRCGYPRPQRDGFMFEAISWIAACQVYGKEAYIKAPHVSSTSQGLDGLMIELSSDKTQINIMTVFEDKCSKDPARTFKNKTLPVFHDLYNKRSAEIIAAATTLLGSAGIEGAEFAEVVTDQTKRRYRAAFAVTIKYDTEEERNKIFSGYDNIKNIRKSQRLGACLVVLPELRDWFDLLAEKAIAFISSLDDGRGGDDLLNVIVEIRVFEKVGYEYFTKISRADAWTGSLCQVGKFYCV